MVSAMVSIPDGGVVPCTGASGKVSIPPVGGGGVNVPSSGSLNKEGSICGAPPRTGSKGTGRGVGAGLGGGVGVGLGGGVGVGRGGGGGAGRGGVTSGIVVGVGTNGGGTGGTFGSAIIGPD